MISPLISRRNYIGDIHWFCQSFLIINWFGACQLVETMNHCPDVMPSFRNRRLLWDKVRRASTFFFVRLIRVNKSSSTDWLLWITYNASVSVSSYHTDYTFWMILFIDHNLRLMRLCGSNNFCDLRIGLRSPICTNLSVTSFLSLLLNFVLIDVFRVWLKFLHNDSTCGLKRRISSEIIENFRTRQVALSLWTSAVGIWAITF